MSRAACCLNVLVMLPTGFLFGGWIVGIAFDYDVSLYMPQAYTWTTAACALAAVWMADIRAKKDGCSAAPVSALCLPFALLYSMSLLWLARWEKVVIPVFICLFCDAYLFRRQVKKSGFRLLCKLFSFALIALYLLLLPGFVLLSDFGKTTIVETLYSPDGRYRALLADIDQGALGGNTDVYVEDSRKSLHLGVIGFQKKTLVYRTGWGAFEGMVLEWQTDSTLSIDGQTYEIGSV